MILSLLLSCALWTPGLYPVIGAEHTKAAGGFPAALSCAL